MTDKLVCQIALRNREIERLRAEVERLTRELGAYHEKWLPLCLERDEAKASAEAAERRVEKLRERAWNDTYSTLSAQVRAALNAAVKAQGCVMFNLTDDSYCHARSYEKGRAEAFEEAAKFFENRALYWSGVVIADHIRALAKEPKK